MGGQAARRFSAMWCVWAGGALSLGPAGAAQAQANAAASAAARPALTVQVTTPQRADWALSLPAAGNIAAWQEMLVGTEGMGGLIVKLPVQVGDVVRKGQLLAQLQSDTLAADLAQTQASLVEARAVWAETQANAARARELQSSGMISAQGATQALTAEQTARARVDAVQARLSADRLRLSKAQVLAPDDGVVSARSATLGAVANPGQELFRLIRQQRLEWRAEVPAADLARVQPGQPAWLTTPGGHKVTGTVRMVAPTVDAQSRNGLVYVDLAKGSDARAGMFARGELQFGQASGLSLPQSAVLLRDGYSVVLRVGADQRVTMTKVTVGRRQADRVEVTAGLAADARVVASGGAFLVDGDRVKVVAPSPAATAAGAMPPAAKTPVAAAPSAAKAQATVVPPATQAPATAVQPAAASRTVLKLDAMQ